MQAAHEVLQMLPSLISYIPVPVVELYVEEDGTEDEPSLQQDGLRVVWVATQQRHLRVPRILHRDVLDVQDKLHLVSLVGDRSDHTSFKQHFNMIFRCDFSPFFGL